jgi:hypothetical protein
VRIYILQNSTYNKIDASYSKYELDILYSSKYHLEHQTFNTKEEMLCSEIEKYRLQEVDELVNVIGATVVMQMLLLLAS